MSIASIWVIIALLLFILELLTPGFVVFCFGVGALLAGGVAYLGGGLVWQVLLFAIGSFASLLFLKPFLVRFFRSKGQPLKTGIEGLIGREAQVISKIEGHRIQGYIAVDGDKWPAYAQDPLQTFQVGEQVRIVANESITIFVAPLAQSDTMPSAHQ